MCRWCECNQKIDYNIYAGDRLADELEDIEFYIVQYENNSNYYLACKYEDETPDPWDSFSTDERVRYIAIIKLRWCPVCGRLLQED